MEYDVKPKNLTRQEKGFPITIQQLIQKYKLDALWENIEKIVKEAIEQNSGYVVKKDGVMYIADNNILEKAKTVLRIGKNFLDISNNGLEGDYQTIISLNGIINADFIQTGSIDANLITTGILDANKVEVTNINAENINSGKIDAELIESNSITSEKISSNAITAEKISSNAITSDKIEAGAVTSEKIFSNAITSDKIATNAIEAKHIKSGSITADDITSGTMKAERIKGGILTVGGNDNGNGEIDVIDSTGKANVLINNNGIILADGTKIVGGDGVYCNLQFFPPQQYGMCGYLYTLYNEKVTQEYIKIYADIPSNFVIENAYITIRHQPITWHYIASLSNPSEKTTIGYSRNVQIYIDDLKPRENIYIDSETLSENVTPGTITNAMGSSGKTFSSSTIEVAKSSNLKTYLTPGKQTVFNIGSTTKAESITSISNAYAQTGQIIAILNVLGFLKKI